MTMRIKIPNLAAVYIETKGDARSDGPTPLQQHVGRLKGHDRILVTDDEDLVDELRDTMSDMVADSIAHRAAGDLERAKAESSAASRTIFYIDEAESRKTNPKAKSSVPQYDSYLLHDTEDFQDPATYAKFAAAIQVARGKKWRGVKWEISGDDGTVLRRFDEQQEQDYLASLPAVPDKAPAPAPEPKPEPKPEPAKVAKKAPARPANNGSAAKRGRPSRPKASASA